MNSIVMLNIMSFFYEYSQVSNSSPQIYDQVISTLASNYNQTHCSQAFLKIVILEKTLNIRSILYWYCDLQNHQAFL